MISHHWCAARLVGIAHHSFYSVAFALALDDIFVMQSQGITGFFVTLTTLHVLLLGQLMCNVKLTNHFFRIGWKGVSIFL